MRAQARRGVDHGEEGLAGGEAALPCEARGRAATDAAAERAGAGRGGRHVPRGHGHDALHPLLPRRCVFPPLFWLRYGLMGICAGGYYFGSVDQERCVGV
jgi:hypothetical protein